MGMWGLLIKEVLTIGWSRVSLHVDKHPKTVLNGWAVSSRQGAPAAHVLHQVLMYTEPSQGADGHQGLCQVPEVALGLGW